MRTPGFVAEFSLYISDRSYRSASPSSSQPVAPAVTPQMKCEEYECSPALGGFPPGYCMRCEGERLK
jgi:hypothetical protein